MYSISDSPYTIYTVLSEWLQRPRLGLLRLPALAELSLRANELAVDRGAFVARGRALPGGLGRALAQLRTLDLGGCALHGELRWLRELRLRALRLAGADLAPPQGAVYFEPAAEGWCLAALLDAALRPPLSECLAVLDISGVRDDGGDGCLLSALPVSLRSCTRLRRLSVAGLHRLEPGAAAAFVATLCPPPTIEFGQADATVEDGARFLKHLL